MRRVISFLGTATRETEYLYKGERYKGSVFQIAMRQFLDFDEMLVFVTDEARRQAYTVLESLNDPRIRDVCIPNGVDIKELWEIFDALVNNVEEKDQVIFDITHGLRSIPFLVFLAAAYLRSAKGIHLEKVLYGALELGKNGPAPVIDLSDFVLLLDWLTATDQFIELGNALALARLLERYESPSLSNLAKVVADISLSLRLLRPREANLAATSLPLALQGARKDLPPPFALLTENLSRSYGRFALPADADTKRQLICQLDMIHWYNKRGQVVHTLSLAREWVISLLCYHFELDPWDRDQRGEMEFLIGGGKQKDVNGTVIKESPYLRQWSSVPEGEQLRELWLKSPYKLAEVRNDVLHSGFRQNARSAQEIIDVANLIVQKIQSIAEGWGLIEGGDSQESIGNVQNLPRDSLQ